jgi:hypothetical protein
MLESDVLAAVRLATSKLGWVVHRNNVGVLRDTRNVPVRYGLANDSKALNAHVKSSDLIGWREVVITPDMVGRKLAQFVSIETKRTGWKYTGADREVAQKRWIDLVVAAGGYGRFVTGEGDL